MTGCKTHPSPNPSNHPPPDDSRRTRRDRNMSHELGARACEPPTMVPAPSYVQGLGFQPRLLAGGGVFGWHRSWGLSRLIGIGWKGTRITHGGRSSPVFWVPYGHHKEKNGLPVSS